MSPLQDTGIFVTLLASNITIINKNLSICLKGKGKSCRRKGKKTEAEHNLEGDPLGEIWGL